LDKLRALEYFNRAVDLGSFAAAARACHVSTAAVTQLIGGLERELGATLFRRSPRGLVLTAEGERYHETAHAVMQALAEAEQRLAPRGATPRGTITVGFRQQLGQLYITPQLARFLARYPDIELVFKPVTSIGELEPRMIDVAVLIGWPARSDYVVRILGETQLFVCAAPEYWQRAGTPRHPEDLHMHHCMVLRSSGGTLLDQWSFAKGSEQCTIDVRARVFSDEGGMLVGAALGGAGVVRASDIVLTPHLDSGRLVRVLTDWTALEAPLVYATYPSRHRRSPVVRAFVQFLEEVFAGKAEGTSLRRAYPAIRPPEWFGKTQGRQSAYAARHKRRQ